MDYFATLPSEVVDIIIGHLSPQDRKNISLLNSSMARLVEQRKASFKRKCYILEPSIKKRLLYEIGADRPTRHKWSVGSGLTPKKRRAYRGGRNTSVSLDDLYLREVNTVVRVDNIEFCGPEILLTVQFAEKDYRCKVNHTTIWHLRDGILHAREWLKVHSFSLWPSYNHRPAGIGRDFIGFIDSADCREILNLPD